jgi:hypothetical protein
MPEPGARLFRRPNAWSGVQAIFFRRRHQPSRHLGMSALCQKRTDAPQQNGGPYSITSSARASNVVGALRPMPLLSGRLVLEDQAEQEMHVAAVGSAFRRLGSIGSPHLAQVPYVPSDIRFRAASI